MSHSALTPVFVGLRVGLHVLITALLVRLPALPPPAAVAGLVLVAVFAAVYVSSAFVRRVPEARRRPVATVWVTVLALVWVGLVLLVPEAAYLAFPLFFLLLHLLPHRLGPVAVVVVTAIAILALGLHQGFSAGVV